MENQTNFLRLQANVKETIQNEIKKLLEPANSMYFLSQADVLNFVRLSNQLISIFSNTDETVEKLLQLLEKANDDQYNMVVVQPQVKKTERRRRQAFSSIGSSENIDHTDQMLISMEKLINSENETVSKNNKMAMIEKVHILMQQLCTTNVVKVFGKF